MQSVFRDFPLFRRAHVLAARTPIPGGDLGIVMVKAERLENIHRKFEATHHFVLDLFGSAEDVRVILRKAAHAQKTMHGSAALVAIDRA